jgi:Na+/proline symporter
MTHLSWRDDNYDDAAAEMRSVQVSRRIGVLVTIFMIAFAVAVAWGLYTMVQHLEGNRAPAPAVASTGFDSGLEAANLCITFHGGIAPLQQSNSVLLCKDGTEEAMQP